MKALTSIVVGVYALLAGSAAGPIVFGASPRHVASVVNDDAGSKVHVPPAPEYTAW